MVAIWYGQSLWESTDTTSKIVSLGWGLIGKITYKIDFPVTQIRLRMAGDTSGVGGNYRFVMYEVNGSELIERGQTVYFNITGTTPTWKTWNFSSKPLERGKTYELWVEPENYSSKATLFSNYGRYFTQYGFTHSYRTNQSSGGTHVMLFQVYGDPDYTRFRKWDGTAWREVFLRKWNGTGWVHPSITIRRT